MNCNCKTDVENNIIEYLKENFPDSKNHIVELSGYGFVLRGNKMILQGVMPYKTSVVVPSKNGEKTKRSTHNMIFNFCPFCGEKAA